MLDDTEAWAHLDYQEGDYSPLSPDGRIWRFSPSQVDTYLGCPRKWAWRYIAGKRSPSTASAQLGTDCHTVLENFLRDGTPLPFSDPSPRTREIARIVATSLPHLPAPKTPGMDLEDNFVFNAAPPRAEPLLFTGKIDVTLSPLATGGRPKIIDHKTSGNIERYGKKEDDLKEDPQAIVYAYYAMRRFRTTSVDLQWNYMATSGTLRCVPVRLTLHLSHVLPRFFAMGPPLMDLSATLISKRIPSSFPGDEDHCSAFGGCPYKPDCLPLFANQNPFARMNKR